MAPNGSAAELDAAFAAHRAGRLDEAERAYRAVLRERPDDPECLHHLGLIAHQRGQSDEALELIERAIAAVPAELRYRFNQAHILEAAGRTDAAQSAYREAQAACGLGTAVLLARGREELEAGRVLEAAHHARTVLAADAASPEALALLGRCRLAQQRHEEAEAAFRAALQATPDDPDAHHGLALIAARAGDAAGATAHLRAALAADPAHLPSLRALAELTAKTEGPAAAVPHWRAVCAAAPGDGPAHLELGLALTAAQDPAGAEQAFHTAARQPATRARALSNLAGVALAQSQHPRAVELAREALAADSRLFEARANLGSALNELSQPAAAAREFAAGLELAPNHPQLAHGYANALMRQGRFEESTAVLRRLLERRPIPWPALSNYLLSLNYVDGDSPGASAAEHRRWMAEWERAVPPLQAHAIDPDPERRLRIGLVSPNFRAHPVTRFLEPGLHHWDRERYPLTFYAAGRQADAVTERLRALGHGWRDVRRVDDAALAAQIAADGIDVLVDLDGHHGRNRLGAFVHRPAPVQVTHQGYPQTTGTGRIDYYLGDAVFTPPEAQPHFAETLYCLPRFFACYLRPEAAPTTVPPPSARDGGPVRFGSFNNIMKLSPRCVALWCRVLAAVPGSRLVLRAPQLGDPDVRRRLAERFAAAGLARDRLELLSPTESQADYFADFARIDIGLDPMPFNGVTTTCDALWMGVPVVTLPGLYGYARAGASILTHLGRPEWIARDEADYVRIATGLAGNVERLARIRAGLREEMARSEIFDGEGFARALETAFRDMWRRWCAEQQRG